ncbi:MAG TPA: serine hydrolase domain-containing protein [Gemmatimonadales bacterium]|nr:serine hydrolase domain-containing protein [Gemmatimonadales bacterium]
MPRLKIDWQPVTHYLDSAVARGAAPGAVLGVTHDGERFVYGSGRLGDLDAGRPGATTLYDLASLTKVVGLTTGLMLAVSEGKIDLDAPVQRYVPAFAGPGKETITVRLLLTHAGGLPAWRPLFREVSSRQDAFALADTTPLEYPPGSRDVYSDLGAIVLTQLLETVYHQRIDSLLEQRIFGSLGLTSLRYRPPSDWLSRIAPTEMDPWRGRVLRGEVHDENAAVMDGVSGHAGLFGSVEDLLGFAEWLLAQAEVSSGQTGSFASHSERSEESAGITSTRDRDHASPGPRPPVRPSTFPTFPRSVVQAFTARQNLVPGSSRALGWDTPDSGSSSGSLLSRHSIGHTGFTGTSIWIDFDRRVAIVLLSNRVHPTRNNPRWNPVRAQIADLVMTTLFEDVR